MSVWSVTDSLSNSRPSSPSFSEFTVDSDRVDSDSGPPKFPTPVECIQYQRQNLAQIQREEELKLRGIHDRFVGMIKKAMQESLTLPVQSYIPYELHESARKIKNARQRDEVDAKMKIIYQVQHDLKQSGWSTDLVLIQSDLKLFLYADEESIGTPK